jgi:hypothetical protein
MQWAEELVALVDLLLRRDPGAPPWPVVRMFWVRLHGVVTEMAEIHRSTAELANGLSAQELEQSLAKFSLSIFTAAKAVINSLEEREAVVADYLRQRAVHLRQTSYALRSSKAGVLDRRRIEHLGKTFAIEDVDRMRDEVFREHGTESEFARYVAGKVRPATVQLFEALRALRDVPGW